jgi:hypothetical protein
MFADHDGIDHEREIERDRQFGDSFDYRPVSQRAELRGLRRNVTDGCLNLLHNQTGIEDFHASHGNSVLYCQEGDDGLAIHSELMKSFQVRLYARSAARIRSGDGERDRCH